jgi:hypothetical protein
MVVNSTPQRGLVPHLLWALVALFFMQAAGGCINSKLPMTDIPDNENTRAIHAKVVAYKEAMEARDVEAIMALVSHRYYENGGTTETDRDDYGYEQLRDVVLPRLRQNVKALQYQVIFRRIEVEENQAFADYEFFSRYLYVEGGREAWDQDNDFNRLTFRMEDGEWMIVAGL